MCYKICYTFSLHKSDLTTNWIVKIFDKPKENFLLGTCSKIIVQHFSLGIPINNTQKSAVNLLCLLAKQSNPVNTDTGEGGGGGIESVRINGVSVLSGLNFRETVRASFLQRQSKLFVMMRCPYYAGKAGSDCTCNSIFSTWMDFMLLNAMTSTD